MMILSRIFGRKKDDATAHELYVALAGQARQPVFYCEGGVPDTLDGRFDLLSLHLFLVLRRLSGKQASAAETGLAQQVFDVMFGDMDRNLREMGVGDLTVGKRIRTMSEAFYGRVEAYETGLQASHDDAILMAALDRNLYRGEAPGPLQLARMATYMRDVAALLAQQVSDDFLVGKLVFCAAPEFN